MNLKDCNQQKRAMAVKNAIASSLLEGAKPRPHVLEKLNQFVDGQVSIESLIATAKRRYIQSGA